MTLGSFIAFVSAGKEGAIPRLSNVSLATNHVGHDGATALASGLLTSTYLASYGGYRFKNEYNSREKGVVALLSHFWTVLRSVRASAA